MTMPALITSILLADPSYHQHRLLIAFPCRKTDRGIPPGDTIPSSPRFCYRQLAVGDQTHFAGPADSAGDPAILGIRRAEP
jgi:hypothetical protein